MYPTIKGYHDGGKQMLFLLLVVSVTKEHDSYAVSDFADYSYRDIYVGFVGDDDQSDDRHYKTKPTYNVINDPLTSSPSVKPSQYNAINVASTSSRSRMPSDYNNNRKCQLDDEDGIFGKTTTTTNANSNSVVTAISFQYEMEVNMTLLMMMDNYPHTFDTGGGNEML